MCMTMLCTLFAMVRMADNSIGRQSFIRQIVGGGRTHQQQAKNYGGSNTMPQKYKDTIHNMFPYFNFDVYGKLCAQKNNT